MLQTAQHKKNIILPSIKPCLNNVYVSKAKTPTQSNRFKIFSEPITPSEAIMNYAHLINDYEILELSTFKEIYYLYKTTNKVNNSNTKHYPFSLNEGIAFRYEMLSILGNGAYGYVFKCFDYKTQKYVAIKTMRRTIDDAVFIDREADILKYLNDQYRNESNIIKYYEDFCYRGFSCIVTDYMDMNLLSYLQYFPNDALPLNQLKTLGKQIAKSIAQVHEAHLVHCDLKPENILVHERTSEDDDTKIYLADFGLALEENNCLTPYVQTLFYRAPEVIFGLPYSKEIDIWSFGCLLFELAAGHPLFFANNEEELIQQMVELMGIPPKEMIKNSQMMKDMFGYPKNEDKTNNDDKKEAIITSLLPFNDSDLTHLICDCLNWIPYKRPIIEEILNNHFFSI